MKVTSLNLRGMFDWESRAVAIERYLKRVDPDVILFQEVVYLPNESPWTQVDLLNRALGYPYRHAAVTRLQESPQFGAYREGLAVVSKTPVLSTEALVLLHESGDPHTRIMQSFDVAVGSEVWPLGNIHLSIRDDRALHQLEEVLTVLALRGEQRIIGGDFNVNRLERHAHLWQEDYVLTTEIKEYVTHAASNQANDYFLVPKAFEMTKIRVSTDRLSDHRALTVDIDRRTPDEPPGGPPFRANASRARNDDRR